MHSPTFRRPANIALAGVALLVASEVLAQEFSLKSNESADLTQAYWVDNCMSKLSSFAGVEILEGPPGITLTIRQQDVVPKKQNCPDKVPGGVVVASVKGVPEKISGTLKYRVRYNTTGGLRQSDHSVQISLYP
jgi:hypothetical protein